jgi:hypothetical protein
MTYNKSKLFEIGSNGDAATTTNTQSDSLSQTASAGAMLIATGEHHSGTRSLHCTGTSTNGLYCMVETLGGLSTFTYDIYYKLISLPSSENTIARLLDAAVATQASLSIGALGQLIIRNAAGTSIYSSPAGKRLTTGAWVHIIWDAVSGTSGTQRSRWFPDGSGTATDDSTVLASNNGSNLFATLRHGAKGATTTATSDSYLDDMQLSGTSPAVANAGPDQTVEPYDTFTLDFSGSDGTITAYNVTQTAGTTVTLSGSGATRTGVAPATLAGDTLTFSLTVTDSSGTSTPDTVNITVPPHTVWRLDAAAPAPVRLVRL